MRKFFSCLLGLPLVMAVPGWATTYTIPGAGDDLASVLLNNAGPGDSIEIRTNGPVGAFDVTDEDNLQILVASGFHPTSTGIGRPAAIITASGVVIDGLELIGLNTSAVLEIQDVSSCQIRNCTIDGSNSEIGVAAANSTCEIENSTITCYDRSIDLGNSSITLRFCIVSGVVEATQPGVGYLTIEDCTLNSELHSGDSAILRRSTLLARVDCLENGSILFGEDTSFAAEVRLTNTDADFIRCEFLGTQTSSIWGSYTLNGKSCSVSDCSFLGGINNIGVNIRDTSSNGMMALLVQNSIFQNVGVGVSVENGGDVSVEECIFEAGYRGVETKNATELRVINSKFHNQTEIGIWVNRVSDMVKEIISIEHCLLYTDVENVGVGLVIDDQSKSYQRRRPVIKWNTIHGWYYGIAFEYFDASIYADVSYNIVSQAAEAGVISLPSFIPTSSWFKYNCVWGSKGCLDEEYSGCPNFVNFQDLSSTNISKAPLFCGNHPALEDDDFELRIDSPCSGGNSGVGLLGAFDVTCAWGALARDTAFDGEAEVLSDLIVPSGLNLELQPGATLRFDSYDESNEGISGLEVELTIDGDLVAQGEQGYPVTFESVSGSPTEGEWFGIVKPSASITHPLSLEWTDIRNAMYGVMVAAGGAPDTCVTVAHSSFRYNQVADLYVSGSGGHMRVAENTFYLGRGDGIRAHSAFGSGGLIAENYFYGDTSFPANGINFNGSGTNQPFSLVGNVFYGIVNGPGILMNPTVTGQTVRPVLKSNTFQDSMYGVQVKRGSVEIGGPTPDDGNLFQELYTRDLDVQCLGPGTGCLTCIDPPVTARHNRFLDSYVIPISTNRTASLDLGQSEDCGYNTILGYGSYCIRNFTPSCGTVQAVGNYFGLFGGECGPVCIYCVSDPGAYATPWLCVDPNEALGPSGTGLSIVGLESGMNPALTVIRSPIPGAEVATVEFEVQGEITEVRAELFDLSGRLVRDLGRVEYAPGRHELNWDSRDDAGRRLAAGIRFLRLSTPSGLKATMKVLTLKGGR